MLRIIDKESKEFIRDGLVLDEEKEEAIDAPPVDAKYKARWNGESWVEWATQEYINSLKAQSEPQEPSLEERIQALEVMELERILGGGF